MRRNMLLGRLSLLCTVAIFSTSGALAQTQTQGAITGTVEDATGAAVPKAAIVVHNDATNAETTLTTDDSGYFNAPLLPPGEYKVTVKAPGFSAYVQDRVIVQVSHATELRPHLALGSEAQTVEVTAVTPVLNFESPEFSDTLDNAQIVNAPVNNRRWSSLALTTPGVVSDSNGYGLVSIRGVSPLMNNVLIDGADDNQAFFSEERGRTREAYSTSQDSVREFSVNTGVFPAEFGRAAGGVINSVTKSGGNQLHGELYFYDRESNWAAYTPLVTNAVLNPTTGTYQNVPIKPKDLRKIWGFSAGGALIHDKLFWYYTYDQHHHLFPGVGRPSNPTTFFTLPETNLAANETCDLSTGELYTGGDISKPTTNTQNQMACVLAARLKLSSYAAGSSVYAAQLASVATTLGNVPRIGDQEINTPKLDFQINSKNRLSLLYHRLRWDSPGGVQTSATATYATDAFGNDFVKLDYGVAKLDSQITSKISNEIGYQYSRELDFETQQPLTPYSQANLISNGNATYVNLATSSGFNLGSPYYSYRLAYPDERKWQVFDTAYWIKGSHSLKFGVDLLHNDDLMNNTFESNGDYSYSYIGNYFADVYAKQHGLANGGCAAGSAQTAVYTASTGKVTSAAGTLPCYNNYFQGYGNPLFDITTTDYGYFVQDDWKVTPRLTVELGVRYDYEQVPNPGSTLTQASGSYTPFPGVTNRPSDKNNFGPRLGFAYDVFGHGQTVLRGGWGLYYGRVLNGTVENIYLNTGSPLGQYTTTFLPTTAGAPAFPALSASSGSAPAAPSAYFFDKHFQNPQVNEFDLILQQDLGKTAVLNVSYLGGLGRELPNFVNLNLDPTTVKLDTITFKGGGPIPDGTVVKVPTYTAYGNQAQFGAVATKFQSITEAVSNINSSYNALVFELKTHDFYGLQADVNYTWSHALDYAQNALTQGNANNMYDPYGSMRSNYGNSNYNVPNRFVAYALYHFPNVHRGGWVKYLANRWTLSDDFQMQNGLPYSVSLSGTPNGAKLSGLNGSGGQSFIPAGVLPGFGIGRNTLQVRRGIVDDLRVVKGIPFTESKVLELRADLFNVANHPNVGSISSTAYIFNSAGTLNNNAVYQPTTFGVPSSINSSGFLFTPREIQISARLTF
ncbi:MAG TPA: TonB-dependent receptor [Acidobacteriaceae bacterium]|nr:TonB-dependent receptor [Acidobacteriaceae bacterium]